MSIFGIIAAFGGGLVGAYVGAVPAFIMTGVLALVGQLISATGASGEIAVGVMAFSSFIGPNVAFAGGVAAAAYARKQGKLADGTNLVSALYGLNAPDVLIVGGVFGCIGYILERLVAMAPVIGGGGILGTDTPGIVVFVLGCVARLVFGETGITGKYTGKGPRQYITNVPNEAIMGLGIGIVVSFTAVMVNDFGGAAALAAYPVFCFGFAAITLVFTVAGTGVPGTHHIFLPAAFGAVTGITYFGEWGCILGVCFGVAGSLIGNFAGNTFNSHCDSHIDPPAFTIFTLTMVNSLLNAIL